MQQYQNNPVCRSLFIQSVETDKEDHVGKLAVRVLKLLLDKQFFWYHRRLIQSSFITA